MIEINKKMKLSSQKNIRLIKARKLIHRDKRKTSLLQAKK